MMFSRILAYLAIPYFFLYLLYYGYRIIPPAWAEISISIMAFIIIFAYGVDLIRSCRGKGLADALDATIIHWAIILSLLLFLDYYPLYAWIIILIYIISKRHQLKLMLSLDKISQYPALTLILSFLFLILGGAYLLTLPVMSLTTRLSSIDALFTSTSAVCVTGLTVKNTALQFTQAGQWVILLLIQLGGLGIMTISSFLLIVLGRQFSIREVEMLKNMYDTRNSKEIFSLFKKIILYTLLIEGLGMLGIYLITLSHSEIEHKIFFAIFHAVSAFCNAGFSTLPDNLIPFQTNWAFNAIIMGLIISGGLGFVVIHNSFSSLGRLSHLLLHSKIALIVSFALIMLGTLTFFWSEFDSTLQGFTFPQKILISLFHSVSARTAGFNSVDFNQVTTLTKCNYLFLMFIGGAPGSTAGGIKVTTFAIILLFAYQTLKEETSLVVFNKTIPFGIISKSIAILVLSSTAVITVFYGLMLTQSIASLDLLFETVSAFGTVGLSTGATSSLNTIGKALIIILMFIGRTGPLTFAFLIRKLNKRTTKISYPQEEIWVG